MIEYLDVFDEEGNFRGTALRSQCHGNPDLLHRTVHVVIRHPETGMILLQKRAATKDIQPGKWDTAVGGHLCPGENYEYAARRELAEELGINTEIELKVLFDAKIRNQVESENTRVFLAEHTGPFDFQQAEIDEVRFWSADELFSPECQRDFTPNLIEELRRLRDEVGLFS